MKPSWLLGGWFTITMVFLAQDSFGQDDWRRTVIHRTDDPLVIDGKRNEPAWQQAESIGDFLFTWWKPGDGPKQQTDARLLWDDRYLYVCFHCTDRDVQATRTERDSDVYRDDCVEVFASPEAQHPEHYFNLEMNALGTQLDNYRPAGKQPKTPWDPEGIRVAVHVDGTLNQSDDVDRSWTLEVAIPFALFSDVISGGHPNDGDVWRLNLNRLEDNMAVKSQWSRGDPERSSFHVPEKFGYAVFRE